MSDPNLEHISTDEEPATRLSRQARSKLDRLGFECRYLRFVRNTHLFMMVYSAGLRAGLWGRSYRRCPVKKPGILHYAWMDGWSHGANERDKLIEDNPKPRPGPNGGSRIRIA